MSIFDTHVKLVANPGKIQVKQVENNKLCVMHGDPEVLKDTIKKYPDIDEPTKAEIEADIQSLYVEIDEICDTRLAKVLTPTQVESQRKHLREIVTRHPRLFSSKFKAGLMKVDPVNIEFN